MTIDPQRLRDLADALQGCEWEVPLCSEQLCRDAADELDDARRCERWLANVSSIADDGSDRPLSDRVRLLWEYGRDAAEEIETSRATALDALAVPPDNETTTYGVLANDKPVFLLASHYKLLRGEAERLRRECALRQRAVERLPLCPDHRDKVRATCCWCEIERLREQVRIFSSPERISETLSEFVRDQAARAAVKGVK